MLFFPERFKNPTKRSMVALRKHRGLNDLLSYLLQWDDSTVLHKDGALSRHFCYIPPDLEAEAGTDLDYHAETWRIALGFLGDGWMVETNVISQPFQSPLRLGEFPDVVSALIHEHERAVVKSMADLAAGVFRLGIT